MRKDGALSVTDGIWLGEGRGSAFGWLSHMPGAVHRSGVLILPPIGYAWWSSYASLRTLAERLAQTGHTVLRLDYHGTGDAPGSQWEPHQLEAWHASVTHGARSLRELGAIELTIVGARLGATIALQEAETLDADRVVAWAPIIAGRREMRAFEMRTEPAPDGLHLSHAGTLVEMEVVAELSRIQLATSTAVAPTRTLVIDGPRADVLTEHLREGGGEAERVEVADGEQALAEAAEDAVVADELVATITDWIGPGEAGVLPQPALEVTTTLSWEGAQVRARVAHIGPARLRGVVCTPAEDERVPGTVVMLNSGSEPHVGPGRAWVELARDLGIAGIRSLRVDFRGWGETPDEEVGYGRPYDPHCVDDTIDIVRAIESDGDGPIVLVGLCAGAWAALRAILSTPVAGVVALNPQMYWQPGDPVEALLSETRRRRAGERAEEEAGRRSGRWDALDRAGERNWAGAWLDELAAGPTTVSMLFAEGDDGLEYLHNRLARRLTEVTASGHIEVREIPEIDHAMHRAWLRPRMFAAIREAAERALTSGAAVGGQSSP